jgi:hypothetical protein
MSLDSMHIRHVIAVSTASTAPCSLQHCLRYDSIRCVIRSCPPIFCLFLLLRLLAARCFHFRCRLSRLSCCAFVVFAIRDCARPKSSCESLRCCYILDAVSRYSMFSMEYYQMLLTSRVLLLAVKSTSLPLNSARHLLSPLPLRCCVALFIIHRSPLLPCDVVGAPRHRRMFRSPFQVSAPCRIAPASAVPSQSYCSLSSVLQFHHSSVARCPLRYISFAALLHASLYAFALLFVFLLLWLLLLLLVISITLHHVRLLYLLLCLHEPSGFIRALYVTGLSSTSSPESFALFGHCCPLLRPLLPVLVFVSFLFPF